MSSPQSSLEIEKGESGSKQKEMIFEKGDFSIRRQSVANENDFRIFSDDL